MHDVVKIMLFMKYLNIPQKKNGDENSNHLQQLNEILHQNLNNIKNVFLQIIKSLIKRNPHQ